MCGIAGLLDRRGVAADELIRRASAMAELLAHRGPDDSGSWSDPAGGVSLAHRRLAVVDLSPTGHQPMVSADGRWVTVYNGELYNAGALRAMLPDLRWRGSSDTEVLLEAVAHLGPVAALQRAEGMFALALWDRHQRELVLARDRFGEKPLYVRESRDGVAFASELSALRADCPYLDVDPDAVAGYLRHGYVPGLASIYAGVRKLGPGTVVTFPATGEARTATYWSLPEVVAGSVAQPLRRRDEPAAVDELDRLLTRSVADRLVADVPVGILLSGGVDSSLVAALAARAAGGRVRTFTIAVQGDGLDESRYARGVAESLGTEHHELAVTGSDVLSLAPEMPAIYDEPFADSSQLPTALVARLARAHVTVALVGDGADELFGGYARYGLYRQLWPRLRRIPLPLRRGLASALRRRDAGAWGRRLTRMSALVPASYAEGNLGEKVVKLADLLEAADPGLLYRRLVSQRSDGDRLVRGVSRADAPGWFASGGPDGFLGRMMYLDALTYLPDDLLVKVDRAAMAVSLETRVPFLDSAVAAFAWRLDDDLRWRGGQGKWLVRQVLHRYVPPALVDRPKMGFAVPIDSWLRGPLRDWAGDHVAAADRWNLLDAGAVRALWTSQQGGTAGLGAQLWTVVMLLAWLDAHQPAVRSIRS